jgi:hypothetical protein
LGRAVVKSDGGLRAEFRKHLAAMGHWCSIETGATEGGVPDLNVCSRAPTGGDGTENWIECKFIRRGWAVKMRAEQVGWHLSRGRRGGRTWIAVRRKVAEGPRTGPSVDDLYLVAGAYARTLRADGLQLTPHAGQWSGGPGTWNWDAIRHLLLR